MTPHRSCYKGCIRDRAADPLPAPPPCGTDASTRVNDYKVQLDVYNGPLDLLLYLIRRHEVDIYDIPIAAVTEQYVSYCDTLRVIDPTLVGDFLVMAATLMEIKSRLLLPTPPPEAADTIETADPRHDLVRQLLEYKRFKDASFQLAAAAGEQAQRWPRATDEDVPRDRGAIDLDDVQIWDLVAAFNQLLTATGRGPITHDVIVDDTPIALHAADIIDRLVSEGAIEFQSLFAGRNRGEMIGLFLALLELIRQARVRAAQESPFAEIKLELLSAEPIRIVDEYEYGPRATEAADAGSNDPSLDGDSTLDSLNRVQAGDDEECFEELDAIRVPTIDLTGSGGPPDSA